jgi:nucleotide-binding universal stress UspA family protein
MSSFKILVPTDFTPTAEKAMLHALEIARKTGDSLELLHIKNNHSKKLLENVGVSLDGLESFMESLCERSQKETGVKCTSRIVEGDILTDINRIASDLDIRMMVIGTHGKVGLRQNVFGSDLLKIASKCPVPVLVVTDKSDKVASFEKIIFPFGSHEHFHNKIDATVHIASAFGSEVHIYSVDKANDAPSKKTLENIDKARRKFEETGVKHLMVHDRPESYSIGFARQTLKYADKSGVKIISVMSVPSATHGFISNSDKEILIENDLGINLLLTSDY